MSSELKEFYKKSAKERLDVIRAETGLTEEEASMLQKEGPLPLQTADKMIENVVGTFPLPLGIATNFQVNGKDYLIPMALEEPSVVAAASNAAKLARASGGFQAEADEPVMIGQIQLIECGNPEEAARKISAEKTHLVDLCTPIDSMLVKFGGGPRDVQARVVETPRGKMVIVHLLVDVRDAMGANAVNTMTEAISPELEKISGGKAVAKIISNLAVYRKARAKAVWKKEVLEESFNGQFKGEEIVERILDVWAFAAGDPFRAATHNKGVMNGIDSLAIATGNDFRAVEAGMHSFAATNSGKGYSPITKYEKTKEGDLLGSIELPIAMGTIGGATRTHPLAQVGLKILGAKNARELSMVAASLGLAQNFGALRAIATEGIQKGHMRLHAHNTAISVGATGEEVAIVAKRIADDGKVRVDYAKQVLEEIRGGK